jgi:hypothetical protein
MEIIETDSWSNFLHQLEDLRQTLASDRNNRRDLLFRGQGNADWRLETTLERYCPPTLEFKRYYRIVHSMRPEIETLANERWIIENYEDVLKLASEYESFSSAMWRGKLPAYEYLTYLRHHGFPSPLLDWTRSLYIAAFFAFQNAAVVASAEKKVSIYVLVERKMKLGSNTEPEVFRLGPNARVHRRHVLQQSEYSICLQFIDNESWQFQPHDKNIDAKWGKKDSNINFMLYKFNIPAKERQSVLRSLDEHNLNAFSLFGSEESLMQTLALRRFTDES